MNGTQIFLDKFISANFGAGKPWFDEIIVPKKHSGGNYSWLKKKISRDQWRQLKLVRERWWSMKGLLVRDGKQQNREISLR